MAKIELLLPAGNPDMLRAAVANGADAVYLGLGHFNARRGASNFNENDVGSVISFCHERGVKVYVAFNILIKNHELGRFLRSIGYCREADAIIIQDPCLIPIIRKNYPDMRIHLSTQATVTNRYSVPEGVDRVIIAREASLEQIRSIAKKHPAEIFVHGALCICYSGQCLFSSFAGGRSGNRGLCAQPCRKKYNNKYLLSTKDLCLIERLPEIIDTGVVSLKVEGRMRSPLYVGTVARIYRKYLDRYYSGMVHEVDKKDVDELKIVFNRGFTEGFAYEDSITDPLMPMNRGLFLGKVFGDKLRLKSGLRKGDGISVMGRRGMVVEKIVSQGWEMEEASEGDVIEAYGTDRDLIFKTSSVDLHVDLGDELVLKDEIDESAEPELVMPEKREAKDTRFFVKVHDEKGAFEAAKEGADTIYCPAELDWSRLKEIRGSRLFLAAPPALTDDDIEYYLQKIDELRPEGVLAADRGLLRRLDTAVEIHIDQALNLFNDIDLSCYGGMGVISPELSLEELKGFRNKRFMVQVHGNIVLMRLKERLSAPELVDEEGRHFRIRDNTEILNSRTLGLFHKVLELKNAGISYFFFDLEKNVSGTLRTYKKILDGDHEGKKPGKGFTTGHLFRGVE